jgi:hypothetical protein
VALVPHRLAGLALVVGALLVLPSAALAAPATVTLRVEGGATTLLPRTSVTTTTTPVIKDGDPAHACSGTSAAGALQTALGAGWTGTWFNSLGYSVDTVSGESPATANPSNFFSFWINNHLSSLGVCGTELQAGDQLLLFVARCDVGPPPDFACTNPPVLPLGLTAPARVSPNAPFTVKVVQFAEDGTPSPVAGAVVSGGTTTATTDAAGNAALSVPRGQTALRATLANHAPSASEPVCGTDGTDGACGTASAVPGGAVAGAIVDRTAPRSRLLSPRSGHVYRFATFSPRLIHIAVAETGSGVRTVKIRLTRRVGNRCFSYSGKRERFIGAKCGSGFFFTVTDRADFTYLLPTRLPRGHYVLDARAIDRSFNRDAVGDRGRNRSVFDVR